MSVLEDTAKALFKHVDAMVTTPALLRAMPSQDFNPGDATQWLEITHFRNTAVNPTWGSEQVLPGFLQIQIVDTERRGEIPATLIASQIIDHFTKNTLLFEGEARVKIYQHPTLLTAIVQPGKTLYPVSIPYQATPR